MSVITKSYGTPDPTQFKDQYKHKYFCEVVQGDVSNVVRQERSVSVVAGTVLPTGSIGFINDKNQAVTDYKPNAKVTFKNNKLAVAGEGDVVIGIVRAADKHHLGCDGVVFTACYHI